MVVNFGVFSPREFAPLAAWAFGGILCGLHVIRKMVLVVSPH